MGRYIALEIHRGCKFGEIFRDNWGLEKFTTCASNVNLPCLRTGKTPLKLRLMSGTTLRFYRANRVGERHVEVGQGSSWESWGSSSVTLISLLAVEL